MKKIFLIISNIALVALCQGQNVKGRVDFNFKAKTDSITIAVVCHDGSFSPDASTLYQMIKTIPGDIELQLHPGTYICRVLHPEITSTDIPLVIENYESDLTFDLKLEKSSLPCEIKRVQLIVRPIKERSKIFSLIKTGNEWSVPQNITLPKDIKTYVFRVNNSLYYHRLGYPEQLQRALLYYENIFQGEDIYFSEDEYSQAKSNISFTSNGIDLEYFYKLYNEIDAVFERSYIGGAALDNSINAKYYLETSSIFEKILKEENPFFSQIVIEPYLFLIDRHHPVSLKIGALPRDEVNRFKKNEIYKKREAKKIALLKLLDVNSPILSGSFLFDFRSYWFGYRRPENYIENDIPFGFFMQLEYDFQQQTPSYCAKGGMLVRDIQQLKREDPLKALQIIDTLEEEYGDLPYVKYGSAEKAKTQLLINQGSAAPDFELVSLKGDTIRLTDFKGKYVFLDFWGTWCAPCMSELPNIKELSETISSDKLIVIGLVCNDTKEKVEKVIREKDLKYINAMANEVIIDDFGISSYPTTYLLDPNGIIIGKNLRGDNLSERIKNILNL